jgi:two-component system heavy metal sensor histidine kinase CusS
MKPPSLLPVYDPSDGSLTDGAAIKVAPFCRKAMARSARCAEHYRTQLQSPPGFSQCPFGFTTRTFVFDGGVLALTGVVAHPRFNTELERQRAKDHPDLRTTRELIEAMVRCFGEIDAARAAAVQSAAGVLPQAFHELRKLNGAVLQHAEKELRNRQSSGLLSIKSAAELMRNNFDILEALSNIDGMRALPLDATINLFDLTYKTKKVLEERANARGMQVFVDGVRALVPGSQKSFPIVPAVLIENAIKYGRIGTTIRTEIRAAGKTAILSVDNETEHPIDPARCFERGTRFASGAVEGGGFGLFLAREIVAAHKGRIVCSPSPGRVRFDVELPLERVIAAEW